jgi:hypothetical protein
MPKQRFTTEEIVHKLRETDALSGQGRTVVDICKRWSFVSVGAMRAPMKKVPCHTNIF